MAKRNLLISVTEYDRDGGLDWTMHGSDWVHWLEWRRGQIGEGVDPAFRDGMIKQELMQKFEAAVDFSIYGARRRP